MLETSNGCTGDVFDFTGQSYEQAAVGISQHQYSVFVVRCRNLYIFDHTV